MAALELPEVDTVRLLALRVAPPVVMMPPELFALVVMVESLMLIVVPLP